MLEEFVVNVARIFPMYDIEKLDGMEFDEKHIQLDCPIAVDKMSDVTTKFGNLNRISKCNMTTTAHLQFHTDSLAKTWKNFIKFLAFIPIKTVIPYSDMRLGS